MDDDRMKGATNGHKRQVDYRALSMWVQRVILRLDPPGERKSPSSIDGTSANEAVRWARNLEFSAPEEVEAVALRDLGVQLSAFDDANGNNEKIDLYDAVLAAAHRLNQACSDFVNPPLNAVWAAARRPRSF